MTIVPLPVPRFMSWNWMKLGTTTTPDPATTPTPAPDNPSPDSPDVTSTPQLQHSSPEMPPTTSSSTQFKLGGVSEAENLPETVQLKLTITDYCNRLLLDIQTTIQNSPSTRVDIHSHSHSVAPTNLSEKQLTVDSAQPPSQSFVAPYLDQFVGHFISQDATNHVIDIIQDENYDVLVKIKLAPPLPPTFPFSYESQSGPDQVTSPRSVNNLVISNHFQGDMKSDQEEEEKKGPKQDETANELPLPCETMTQPQTPPAPTSPIDSEATFGSDFFFPPLPDGDHVVEAPVAEAQVELESSPHGESSLLPSIAVETDAIITIPGTTEVLGIGMVGNAVGQEKQVEMSQDAAASDTCAANTASDEVSLSSDATSDVNQPEVHVADHCFNSEINEQVEESQGVGVVAADAGSGVEADVVVAVVEINSSSSVENVICADFDADEADVTVAAVVEVATLATPDNTCPTAPVDTDPAFEDDDDFILIGLSDSGSDSEQEDKKDKISDNTTAAIPQAINDSPETESTHPVQTAPQANIEAPNVELEPQMDCGGDNVCETNLETVADELETTTSTIPSPPIITLPLADPTDLDMITTSTSSIAGGVDGRQLEQEEEQKQQGLLAEPEGLIGSLVDVSQDQQAASESPSIAGIEPATEASHVNEQQEQGVVVEQANEHESDQAVKTREATATTEVAVMPATEDVFAESQVESQVVAESQDVPAAIDEAVDVVSGLVVEEPVASVGQDAAAVAVVDAHAAPVAALDDAVDDASAPNIADIEATSVVEPAPEVTKPLPVIQQAAEEPLAIVEAVVTEPVAEVAVKEPVVPEAKEEQLEIAEAKEEQLVVEAPQAVPIEEEQLEVFEEPATTITNADADEQLIPTAVPVVEPATAEEIIEQTLDEQVAQQAVAEVAEVPAAEIATMPAVVQPAPAPTPTPTPVCSTENEDETFHDAQPEPESQAQEAAPATTPPAADPTTTTTPQADQEAARQSALLKLKQLEEELASVKSMREIYEADIADLDKRMTVHKEVQKSNKETEPSAAMLRISADQGHLFLLCSQAIREEIRLEAEIEAMRKGAQAQ